MHLNNKKPTPMPKKNPNPKIYCFLNVLIGNI